MDLKPSSFKPGCAVMAQIIEEADCYGSHGLDVWFCSRAVGFTDDAIERHLQD